MAWLFAPVLPTSTTFSGQILFNATDLEVESAFKRYVESVEYEVLPQYEIKNTGFEKKKYKKTDSSTIRISIMLVGNLPFWLQQVLIRLAIGINGAGMTLNFRDSFCSGTPGSPVTYNCRWINAGDFVDNNELLNGGSMELIAYTLPEDEGRWSGGVPDGGDYEKTIDAPGSGLECELHVEDADADLFYTRVIG